MTQKYRWLAYGHSSFDLRPATFGAKAPSAGFLSARVWFRLGLRPAFQIEIWTRKTWSFARVGT